MEISRSRLYHFKHNDMDDLERVLHAIDDEDKKVGLNAVMGLLYSL
jgi:7-keto-8-aminopelargonate synthetase-like enzyme